MSEITFHDLDEFKLPEDPRKTLEPGEAVIFLKSYDSTESLYGAKNEDGTILCVLFKDEKPTMPPPPRKSDRKLGIGDLIT